MPVDSQGGEARNHEEIEAVGEAMDAWLFAVHGKVSSLRASEVGAADVIAALDRVRSSGSAAQNHEEAVAALNEALPYKPMVNEWDLDSPDPFPQGEDYEADAHEMEMRAAHGMSPQGEDHEARIEAALEAFWPAIPVGNRHANGDNYRRFMADAVAAYLSRASSPVSGTEPDTEKLGRKRTEIVDDAIIESLTADMAKLVEALKRIAYGLEGEMGRYDTPRDDTWWGRVALEALSGFSGPQEPQGGLDAMNDASKEKQ